MSVKHIFLALLTTKPMHGYELKEAFEKLVFNQWPLNYGQVYTTLLRLERDSFVSHEDVEQEEKPDKKVYHITDTGKKELEHWLYHQSKWNVYFDDIAFKTALFEVIEPKYALDILQQYKKYLFSVLKSLIQLRNEMTDSSIGKQLILERNILQAESDLKWINLCQQKLGGFDND